MSEDFHSQKSIQTPTDPRSPPPHPHFQLSPTLAPTHNSLNMHVTMNGTAHWKNDNQVGPISYISINHSCFPHRQCQATRSAQWKYILPSFEAVSDFDNCDQSKAPHHAGHNVNPWSSFSCRDYLPHSVDWSST